MFDFYKCDEWCNECDNVEEDTGTNEVSICSSCGSEMLPCSACDEALDGTCDWEEQIGCKRFRMIEGKYSVVYESEG